MTSSTNKNGIQYWLIDAEHMPDPISAQQAAMSDLKAELSKEGTSMAAVGRGDAGTEILTRIINDFFATMLEIMAKSNGQLLKFAGDALEAFFPAPRRGSEVPRICRV